MSEVIRFKGYMNIMTLLSFLIFFLSKSKLNIIPLLFLIPNIIISNCNSAIMGIIIGVSSCLVFFLYIFKAKKKLRINNINRFFFFCFSTIFAQNLLEITKKQYSRFSIYTYRINRSSSTIYVGVLN